MKVLISPGYGAGWSTWGDPGMATDKRLIELFECGCTEEEILSVNSSYLSTMFSKEMDTTFVKFLTAKRLEKARDLLAKERMHTADVAAAVGYKDSHYFSFVFRKMYGMSPKEYRNQNS